MPNQCFIHLKVNFEQKKKTVLLIEKFPFLELARNTIKLQHIVIIHVSLHHLSCGRLQQVINKENFKLLALKVVAVVG